jgi:hypothetical protein
MVVRVIYNGINYGFELEATATVGELHYRAVSHFGPVPDPELLAFFDREGRELGRSATLEGAGVKHGDDLLLRPTVIR